tara:strand:+ start:186132 stop:187313 length:1182 start_codon:yes stop_codon:yes gene_type:complete
MQTENTATTNIARGRVRFVGLGDLPDNHKLFDKIDELDFAVRYSLSPELKEDIPSVRYMDCLIWMKPNVFFDSDQIIGLSGDWQRQINELALEKNWVEIGEPLTVAEYSNSIGTSFPPSKTTPVSGFDDGGLVIDAETVDITPVVDTHRIFIGRGMTYRTGMLVGVTSDREMMLPYGTDEWMTLGGGRLSPLPRETLSQGALTICKVKEPLGKIGPDGWRVIVSGGVNGCSALLIISDEFNFNDTALMEAMLRKLNYKWSSVYDNAGLSPITFAMLQDAVDFKLARKFYPITTGRFSELLGKVKDIEFVEWKYPSLKFNPVRHKDVPEKEFRKMKLIELTDEQRQELELNLVNYLPTVDWPEEGEDVVIPAPFGDVELTWKEWENILNGYSVS